VSVLDPRITPARPDLAASHLEGQVEAERFVDPVDYQAVDPVLPIRRGPDRLAGMDDQLLFGDVFAVLEERDGWGWGFSRADGYVGWVEMSGLSREVDTVDRKIIALRTYAFSEPDFKSPPAALISLNASFHSGAQTGRFIEAANLGWIVSDHTASLDHAAPDFVAVAESFLAAPYLWGGKESLGLDCSGLLQMALVAAGIDAPRDADQQEQFLKARWRDVTQDTERARGDVVFWPGHVGVMTDSEFFLHANAYTMDTTLEPFAEAEQRIREKENPVRTIMRPPAS